MLREFPFPCSVCIGLLMLSAGNGLRGTVLGADEATDRYDTLYDVIMIRKDSAGVSHGRNEVGPLIYARSGFPFDDETFPGLTSALEQFNALSRREIEAYGLVKRALLQRHLWVVFDATMWSDYMPATHMDRRLASQKLLAKLIRRLALTKAEIRTLPDTRAATIECGEFPAAHDPADRFSPFLPAGLYSRGGSWVCLGKVDHAFTDHGNMARWRSVFLQFLRLPGGRQATLEYIEKLNDREVFPVGTQFALIDQAFLISDAGELVLSPLINSIQLRAYLNVTRTDLEAHPDANQCVAEFLMQPRQLMQGQYIMRPMGPEDRRYKFLDVGSGGKVDWFEHQGGESVRHMQPRLHQCTHCHGRSTSGIRSLGDFSHGDRIADRYTFEEGNPVNIAGGVAALKRGDETWKKLQELWSE